MTRKPSRDCFHPSPSQIWDPPLAERGQGECETHEFSNLMIVSTTASSTSGPSSGCVRKACDRL